MNFIVSKCVVAALCLSVTVGSAAPVAKPKATATLRVLTVRDSNDQLQKPFAANQRAKVLIFIAHDCPIANGYAPEINRICRDYAAQKIDFYLVHADPQLKPEVARQHAKEYGFKVSVLLDTKFALARATGATVTPEAVVFAPDNRLIYRGRIDNKTVAYGKTRTQATQHDLRDVLQCIVVEKIPAKPILTTAVGCFIPFL